MMQHDPFVAFAVGTMTGLVLGIVLAAILHAISNNIERRGNENE